MAEQSKKSSLKLLDPETIPEESHKGEFEEEMVSQVGMLATVQRNMTGDVVLNMFLLIVFSEMLRNNPDLNEPKHYLDINFDETHNDNWNQFRIGSRFIGCFPLSEFLSDMPDVRNCFTAVYRDILNCLAVAKSKMVASTLRLHGQFSDNNKIDVRCMWIEKKDITNE